jgi:hypothetical protein
MNWYIGIMFIVALVTVGFMIFLTVTRRKRTQTTNFRALLLVGFSFIPVGIATKNYLLWLIGFLFIFVSLINRKQWKIEKRWQELPVSEKAVRFFMMAIAVILLLASVTLFFIKR